MSYRLFAALPVPDEIRDQLQSLQSGLDGAKWRYRENFHITLRFYGELGDTRAQDLDGYLADISLPALRLKLKGIGHFGKHDPHAVWASVENTEAISHLAQKCDTAAAHLHLKKDKHAFRPHITLAYLNGTNSLQVADYAERHAMFETSTFTVDRFVLYSSWPAKHQSRYEEEASYPLLG
jgi:2'-5' RNA ligase